MKIRINPEMLVGVSAVVIGVCALAVSVYETSLMREEQRASVIPLLELSRSWSGGDSGDPEDHGRLWIHAENVGIGPARIVSFNVTVDGVPKRTWGRAMADLLGREQLVGYGQSTISGRTIPPDRMVNMFELNDTEFLREILAEFDRLDFEACFCSIFDECWTTSYSAFGASQPVESCEGLDWPFVE